jgi:tRNA threonylcarbamoyladenosine biosynthesis protein TsaE
MELGAKLALTLEAGAIVTLQGELGAGKTHLAKGICSGLGVALDLVNSPTFNIVNEYNGRSLTIYHIDGYRVERVEEFHELGIEDYIFSDAVCLIEWPERIIPLLPKGTIRLQLSHLAPDRRRVELVDAE